MGSASEELKHAFLVKCGGFSGQLAKHVGDRIDGDPLWGSRFDKTNPDAVIQTHLDFLQNGAQIILSNTYQSSIEGFVKHLALSKEQSIELMRQSVRHAQVAKQTFIEAVKAKNGRLEPELPLVLASIGPFGAHLHDGSEYSGNYADRVSKEQIQNWHRPRIEACLAEGVDGLAIETIPCLMEAEAVVEMVITQYPNARFWVSFQCKDKSHLAHGENFSNAAIAVWNLVKSHNAINRLFAIGVNCVNPNFVSALFKSLHELQAQQGTASDSIPLIVYSNRGETYDTDIGQWMDRDKCIPLESYVPNWISMGAKIIGGCCRVYPDDILKIRKCVDNVSNNN